MAPQGRIIPRSLHQSSSAVTPLAPVWRPIGELVSLAFSEAKLDRDPTALERDRWGARASGLRARSFPDAAIRANLLQEMRTVARMVDDAFRRVTGHPATQRDHGEGNWDSFAAYHLHYGSSHDQVRALLVEQLRANLPPPPAPTPPSPRSRE